MSDFRLELKREKGRKFVNAPIPAGDYFLSVQASEGHYCEPQETLEDPREYSSFEVAVFDKNMKWVNPKETLTQFSWYTWFDGGVKSVALWVSVKEVEQIRFDLRSLKEAERQAKWAEPQAKWEEEAPGGSRLLF